MSTSTFDGRALGNQVVGIVRDYVQRKNEDLTREIRALEYALINYGGVYEQGKCYPAGSVVAHGGSLWRAAYKTASQPGDGPAWMQWLVNRDKE